MQDDILLWSRLPSEPLEATQAHLSTTKVEQQQRQKVKQDRRKKEN